VRGLQTADEAVERVVVVGSLGAHTSFEAQARLVGLSREAWQKREDPETPLLRSKLVDALEFDIAPEVKISRKTFEQEIRERSRSAYRFHCYEELDDKPGAPMVVRERIHGLLSLPSAVCSKASGVSIYEMLTRLAPWWNKKKEGITETVIVREMMVAILAVRNDRSMPKMSPLVLRRQQTRPMGESGGLPILFLFGALCETKAGALVCQLEPSGKPLVAKDLKKASALGTKLAERHLENSGCFIRDASMKAIEKIATHESVVPHVSSLHKLNVLPKDCRPSEYDEELWCCDGAQVWLVWLVQVLRAELQKSSTEELMKEAIRLVLKELLLSKVCAKGGGTAGWLAPATAKELATLHDPPPPKLQPAALRDKERRVPFPLGYAVGRMDAPLVVRHKETQKAVLLDLDLVRDDGSPLEVD